MPIYLNAPTSSYNDPLSAPSLKVNLFVFVYKCVKYIFKNCPSCPATPTQESTALVHDITSSPGPSRHSKHRPFWTRIALRARLSIKRLYVQSHIATVCTFFAARTATYARVISIRNSIPDPTVHKN